MLWVEAHDVLWVKVSSPLDLQKCNLTLLYSWPNMNKCSHSLRVSLHKFTLELCVSAVILFQMWPMVPKLLDYLPSNNRHHTIRKTMAAVPNVSGTNKAKMEINRIVGHLKVFILLFYNSFDSPGKRASLRCNLTSCGGNFVFTNRFSLQWT